MPSSAAVLVCPGAAPAPLRVTGYRGEEAMSSAYRYEIDFVVSSVGDVEAQLLGSHATLVVGSGQGVGRHITGLVHSVELRGRAPENDGRVLRVELAPTFHLLESTRRSRVFQDMSLREIVEEVLVDWGIEASWRLDNTYVARPYCVQYQESDADFLRRLLASEGVFFYFTSEPPPETAIPQ